MVRDYTRAELLALLPERYLAEGYCDGTGLPRPELRTEWATAAATQLLADEVAPQELAFTLEAFRFSLDFQEGDARTQAADASREALATVTRMIQQPNNEGLIQWLEQCAAHVASEDDLAAMESHMEAVLLLYAVVAEYAPSSSQAPPSSSSSEPLQP